MAPSSCRGISLGSGRIARLKAPRVLLAWAAPVSTLSAGFARYVLEQRYGQRVTAMRTATLQNYDMKDYDVLVLPSATYSFSDEGLRRLKDWIRNGGTLITVADASRWAARDRVGLLSTDTLMRNGSPRAGRARGGGAGRRGGRCRRETGPGEAVRLREGDPARARAAGKSRGRDPPRHAVSVSLAHGGSRRRHPDRLRGGAGVRAAETRCGRQRGLVCPGRSAGRRGPRVEGSTALIAERAFLMHQPTGRGHVVAFAEDPNYRAYSEATQLLFINAVLLGVAH